MRVEKRPLMLFHIYFYRSRAKVAFTVSSAHLATLRQWKDQDRNVYCATEAFIGRLSDECFLASENTMAMNSNLERVTQQDR